MLVPKEVIEMSTYIHVQADMRLQYLKRYKTNMVKWKGLHKFQSSLLTLTAEKGYKNLLSEKRKISRSVFSNTLIFQEFIRDR